LYHPQHHQQQVMNADAVKNAQRMKELVVFVKLMVHAHLAKSYRHVQ
jgi:hypothetical protein